MNSSAQPPHDLLQDYTHTNQCVLEALVPEVLGQQHVHALFDLVPGMRSCVLDRRTGNNCDSVPLKMFSALDLNGLK